MKKAVLNADVLVPEAYRQRSRECRKRGDQSYVEFARENEMMFGRLNALEEKYDRL